MTRLSISECTRAVEVYYGLSHAEILGPDRAWRICRPRQIAMTLAREFTAHSLPRIGHYFGDKDHTTVLHAIRSVASRCQRFPEMAEDLNKIRRVLTVFAARKAEREEVAA